MPMLQMLKFGKPMPLNDKIWKVKGQVIRLLQSVRFLHLHNSLTKESSFCLQTLMLGRWSGIVDFVFQFLQRWVIEVLSANMHLKLSIHAWHCFKYFANINSYHPHNHSERWLFISILQMSKLRNRKKVFQCYKLVSGNLHSNRRVWFLSPSLVQLCHKWKN